MAPSKAPSKKPAAKAAPIKKPKLTGRNIVGDRTGADLRMRLFAHEFHINGGNAKKAALAAGYSPASAEQQGSDLLRNPKVITHLQALSAQSARDSIAAAPEVHERLTSILRADSDVPWLSKAGLIMGPPSAADRIKAGSELMKMRGGYAPVRVEVVVQNQVSMWVVQSLQIIKQQLKLSEQQLEALATALPPLTLEQGR